MGVYLHHGANEIFYSMKKITLTFLFFYSFIQAFSQHFVTTTVWKAETKSGGVFIGVAEDEYEASNVIEELAFEKQGTKYEIVGHEVSEINVNIYDSEDVFEDFVSQNDELEYKYISEIELIALEYIEDNDLNMAIKFYKNVSYKKSESLIQKHLTMLKENYSKYIFEENEASVLVGFSE